jgi:hypothetical protein
MTVTFSMDDPLRINEILKCVKKFNNVLICEEKKIAQITFIDYRKLVTVRTVNYLEGYPAALIRTVSRTPQARSCWTARFGSNSKATLESLGLIQRT